MRGCLATALRFAHFKRKWVMFLLQCSEGTVLVIVHTGGPAVEQGIVLKVATLFLLWPFNCKVCQCGSAVSRCHTGCVLLRQ